MKRKIAILGVSVFSIGLLAGCNGIKDVTNLFKDKYYVQIKENGELTKGKDALPYNYKVTGYDKKGELEFSTDKNLEKDS
jgi:uncharacterized protein YxeA